jgi:beta-lactamase class A
MKRNSIIFIIGLLIGGLGVFAATYKKPSGKNNSRTSGAMNIVRQNNSGYKFIKPLLASGYSNQDDQPKLSSYEDVVETDVNNIIKDNPDVEVGFYFNDLTNLIWVGVHESDEFVPASTLKVPMLIAYYKLRETTEPHLFETKITYKGTDYDQNKNITSDKGIKPGQTYTIGEMLQEMIIYSDNNALEFLYNYRQDALKNIFDDLQAPFPSARVDIANKDFLSPKEWAKFIIVLYNASYLDRKDSESAMELLTKTDFNNGLVAGVPDDIMVAHKFGERRVGVGTASETDEMHDCGIVYYSPRPYLICVMTKGKSLDKQTQVIKQISEQVYTAISSGNVGALRITNMRQRELINYEFRITD